MANLGPIHHVTHHVNPTPHAPPSSLLHPPPSTGLISSSTSFVQAHKKALLVGAGAVTLAAAGYYYYTTTAAGGKKAGGGETDLESGKAAGGAGGSASGSSKRRKKKSAKKGVNDPDGPLLEEVKPKKEKSAAVAEEVGEDEVKLEKKDGTSSLPPSLPSPLRPSFTYLLPSPCSPLSLLLFL